MKLQLFQSSLCIYQVLYFDFTVSLLHFLSSLNLFFRLIVLTTKLLIFLGVYYCCGAIILFNVLFSFLGKHSQFQISYSLHGTIQWIFIFIILSPSLPFTILLQIKSPNFLLILRPHPPSLSTFSISHLICLLMKATLTDCVEAASVSLMCDLASMRILSYYVEIFGHSPYCSYFYGYITIKIPINSCFVITHELMERGSQSLIVFIKFNLRHEC